MRLNDRIVAALEKVLRQHAWPPVDSGGNDESLTSIERGGNETTRSPSARSSASAIDEDGYVRVGEGVTNTKNARRCIRLAVLDHITSMPCVVLPIARMVRVCHKYGVPVLVDGAHAVGNIALNVPALGADFYTSNCHKWLCTAKGCAFLWVKPCWQSLIHPTVVSHGFGVHFASEFFWAATNDYTAYLSLTEAVRWFTCYGAASIRKHNHELSSWAATMLSEMWNTSSLPPLTNTPAPCCAVMVRLPTLRDGVSVAMLTAMLRHRHDIEVPAMTYNGNGYVRISAHIYSEREEYIRLGRAVLHVSIIDRSRRYIS